MNNQKGMFSHQKKINSTSDLKPQVYFWRGGQSLVELLVGLGIISILIGASSYALVLVLRSSTVTEQNQTGGQVQNSLLESASTLAEADWNKVYNLSKGSSYHYFVIGSPTTTPMAISGDESVLSDNITNGLVGHWKFDENAGSLAYDSSGKGNYGSLVNSPTRVASTSCKVGECLSFDGLDDYFEVTVSQTKTAYSLWVKNDSVWEYVVNNNGTYYVNGASGTPTSYPIYVSGNTVQIGKSGASSYVQAFIDDVRIYDRALSAAEISQLYNSQVYSRYFYVDNVKRTICGTGNITADAESTCLGASGVSQDPATQKITVSASWNLKGVSEVLENSVYVTRWVNSVSKQSDWGGSGGTAGAVSEFGTNYFDYSSISTTTSGSIKVSGI